MNTKDSWLTTAMIHDEPRRALWSTVFPDGVVPIKSIFTLKLSVPEHHQDVDCYMLDLDALSDMQINGVIAVISLRFGIPEAEVRNELYQGVPIIAEGVSVSTRDQGIFFSLMGDGDAIDYADQFLEVKNESVDWEDD